MKKIVLATILIITILLLPACGTADQKGTIIPAKLTEREINLISLNNSKYFVFDYEAPVKYKHIEFILEEYRLGKKVADRSTLYSGDKVAKGMILASLSDSVQDGMAEHNWTMKLASENQQSSSQFSTESEISGMNMWDSNPSESISITDQEILLGTASYMIGENTILSSLSDDFYKEPAKHMEELDTQQLIYLLKCRFY